MSVVVGLAWSNCILNVHVVQCPQHNMQIQGLCQLSLGLSLIGYTKARTNKAVFPSVCSILYWMLHGRLNSDFIWWWILDHSWDSWWSLRLALLLGLCLSQPPQTSPRSNWWQLIHLKMVQHNLPNGWLANVWFIDVPVPITNLLIYEWIYTINSSPSMPCNAGPFCWSLLWTSWRRQTKKGSHHDIWRFG